jgi:predicted PurR-regulated permease PerM
LKIELWIYVIVAVGLLILRVPYFYLAALGIAFLDILPVFGTGTVLLPWAVLKFLGGQYYFAIGLLIIWGVGQLTRQVIQPKIVGDSLGIQPIPTLVLLYLGYQLAGVAGMIAAVPLGMLVMTMNDAGFFDNVKTSIRILWHGFNEFRRLTPEDMGDNTEEKEETDA